MSIKNLLVCDGPGCHLSVDIDRQEASLENPTMPPGWLIVRIHFRTAGSKRTLHFEQSECLLRWVQLHHPFVHNYEIKTD